MHYRQADAAGGNVFLHGKSGRAEFRLAGTVRVPAHRLLARKRN